MKDGWPGAAGGFADAKVTAESWRTFVEGLAAKVPVRGVILDSWRRSSAAGVVADAGTIRPVSISERELQRRLKENADLVAVAGSHLRWMSAALEDVPHVVYLVDRDGIVLDSTGTLPQICELGLMPGYDWSEARMGTNGAGTAISADQPVVVVGPEHYVDAFHDCTCAAAPIHDPNTDAIGAVDITTSAADGKPERLVLATYVARVIEHELCALWQQREWEEARRLAQSLHEHEYLWRGRLVDLLTQVSFVIDNAESFESVHKKVLRCIVQGLGWPLGHTYMRDPSTSRLVESGAWYVEAPEEFFDLVEILRESTFAPHQGAATLAASSGEVCWLNHIDNSEWFVRATAGNVSGVRTVVAIPVLVGGSVIAVVELFHRDAKPADPQTVHVLGQIGAHISRLFERRRLEQQILKTSWHQQRAFGQELHDTVAQELAALGMRAERLTRRLRRADHELGDLAAGLAHGLRQSLARVRALASGLLPVEVDAEAFPAALERLAANAEELYGLEWELVIEGRCDLEDNDMAIHLYRIAQETIANAARHAGASRLTLRIAQEHDTVELVVQDDGVGIRVPTEGDGLGLHIMRYRAAFIGGSLDVGQGPQGGTRVTCRVPLRARQSGD